MLHAKFQDHRNSGSGEEDFLKVFTINGHGSNFFGHVIMTIFYEIYAGLHIKFGFDWPSGFREKDA